MFNIQDQNKISWGSVFFAIGPVLLTILFISATPIELVVNEHAISIVANIVDASIFTMVVGLCMLIFGWLFTWTWIYYSGYVIPWLSCLIGAFSYFFTWYLIAIK